MASFISQGHLQSSARYTTLLIQSRWFSCKIEKAPRCENSDDAMQARCWRHQRMRFNRSSRYTYMVAQLAQLQDDQSLPWNTYPCLEWPFYRDPNGYGHLYHLGMQLVHRESFKVVHPDFDDVLHILHRCDNPPCFRPVHLFSGTNRDNVHDAMRKGIFHGGSPHLGSENGNSKLKEYQVVEIKKLIAAGAPSKDIAITIGISRRTVNAIKKGEIWRGV